MRIAVAALADFKFALADFHPDPAGPERRNPDQRGT
jgi:hypothetical protein